MYDQVAVVWNGKIIDYEAMITLPLSEDSLRQVCGENTTFKKIRLGYGVFPLKHLQPNVINQTKWFLGILVLFPRGREVKYVSILGRNKYKT